MVLQITSKNSWPESNSAYKFPYPILAIVVVWTFLGLAYGLCKFKQKARSTYVIPRVFVLCSPRTVQFHYELILRVGLPSYDFNPDKHDIDLTIQGQSKNEVVPTTRLNTKTLLDEPLITNLSLIVYRLVEMPPLGGLVLRHSGPFKSWLYVYDFIVIDLSTNKEFYYPLNQYIGSLNRILPLDETIATVNCLQYPIDDVPLPSWKLEDIFLFLYMAINSIMLTVTLMPINCDYSKDIISVFLTAFGGGTLVFFLNWLLYYQLKWNQDRKEYFNNYKGNYLWAPSESVCRSLLAIGATAIGAATIYFSVFINDWRDSLVWLLAVMNSCSLVIGFWNAARQADIGETLVALGLRFKGIQMVSIGMRYSDMVADVQSKSGSASEESSSTMSERRFAGSVGPRSSVKSFGFDAAGLNAPSRVAISSIKLASRLSNTGATPNNHPSSQIMTTRKKRHSADKRHAPTIPSMPAPTSHAPATSPTPVTAPASVPTTTATTKAHGLPSITIAAPAKVVQAAHGAAGRTTGAPSASSSSTTQSPTPSHSISRSDSLSDKRKQPEKGKQTAHKT